VALCLGGGFLIWFILSVKGGQYDDMHSPAYRVLLEEEKSEGSQSDDCSEPEKTNENSE
jgi:cbb3-type cytochrome oxidase maturation protein